MSKESVTYIIEQVCDDICNNYCKYQEQYNPKEHDDIELADSEICENCPLNKLY